MFYPAVVQHATSSTQSMFSVRPRVVSTTHHASTTLFSREARPPPSWKSSFGARSMTASRRFPGGGADGDATRSSMESFYSRRRSADQHRQARHQYFHHHASSQSPLKSSPDVGSQCGNVPIMQRRCRVDLDRVCGHAPRLQTYNHDYQVWHSASTEVKPHFLIQPPTMFVGFVFPSCCLCCLCSVFGDITPNQAQILNLLILFIFFLRLSFARTGGWF